MLLLVILRINFMTVADTLIIDRILNTAELRRASDIHFIIGSYPILRVAGNLDQLTDEKLVDASFMSALISYFFGEDVVDLQTNKNKIRQTIFNRGENSRLRVEVYMQKGDRALTIKRISDRLPKLESLPYANLIEPLLAGHGLIVISGSYNSGKSSACGAVLQFINSHYNRRVITFEDPIERLYINDKAIIEQRQIGRDIDTATSGLKQVIDQDVDVVMVGKVQDKDTVEAILNIINANKLVIVEVDHLSLISWLTAWRGLFPADQQPWVCQTIGDNLRLAVAQEFVPALMTGEQVLIAEVLSPSDTVSQLIGAGRFAQLDSTLCASNKPDLISFDNALIEAASRGLIDNTIAINAAHDKKYVQQKIGNSY
jgi:twitching motility protein PilT